jgi:hypothetical protein
MSNGSMRTTVLLVILYAVLTRGPAAPLVQRTLIHLVNLLYATVLAW